MYEVLACEMIGYFFCRNWDIVIPNVALIKIDREHKGVSDLNDSVLDGICFGSLHSNEYLDVNDTTHRISKKHIRELSNKEDILKIGLLDLWLSNLDRNSINHNLMLSNENIIAIDHGMIFESGNLYHIDGSIIDNSKSILHSPFFKALYPNEKSILECELFNEISVFFDNKIKDAEMILERSFFFMPVEWGIDKRNAIAGLLKMLTDEERNKNIIKSFKVIISLNY